MLLNPGRPWPPVLDLWLPECRLQHLKTKLKGVNWGYQVLKFQGIQFSSQGWKGVWVVLNVQPYSLANEQVEIPNDAHIRIAFFFHGFAVTRFKCWLPGEPSGHPQLRPWRSRKTKDSTLLSYAYKPNHPYNLYQVIPGAERFIAV